MNPSTINNSIFDNRYDYYMNIEDSEDQNDDYLNEEYIETREKLNEMFEMEQEFLTPLKQKPYYNYQGLSTLQTALEVINPFQIQKIHICPFNVNTSGKHPFLEYMLVKNKYFVDDEIHLDNELNFLSVPYVVGLNIIEYCKQGLGIFLMRTTDMKYKGYIFENGNVFVFFDVSRPVEERAVYKDNYTNGHFCLMDEIINNSATENNPIGSFTKEFFLNHIDLVFLRDIEGENIELPTVVYAGTTTKQMEFESVFGHARLDSGAILGPQYYFTNYANSLKQANQAVIEYKNRKGVMDNISGAIVRFAVFLGKINVPTELPKNDEEQEEIFKNYNSVFLNDLRNLDGPVWVLTNYEQQIPISYMRVRV